MIIGRELTVTVIENKNKIKALEVTEIKFKNKHYDYNCQIHKE